MASVIEKTIRSAVTKGVTAVHAYNRKRLPEPDRPHPYLTGINAPMQSEETLHDLKVTGTIPAGLDGRYLRIGPNPVTPPDAASYHWFLGDGMAHGVRIQGGKALWYRNRWVRSNAVSAALGEPPVPGARNPRSDTANTNIVGIGGRTYAIVEAGGKPVELDDDLNTLAHNPFDGTLENGFSAHPHIDPATGHSHAITYDAATQDRVWHVVVDAQGKVIREEPVRVAGGPSIHDCAITENHVLVFDLPVTFSMKSLLQGHSFPYAWNESHAARVGLLPKNGTSDDVIWCDVDPAYVFHPANARENADGSVSVEVIAHDSMFARSRFGPDSRRSRLERWDIDPKARSVARHVLHDRNQEFPRYDERRTCGAYRYVYTMALPDADHVEMTIAATSLYKHDLHSGETCTHDFGPDRHPGEFVFIPAREDAAEDEGWLMGLVVDMAAGKTELVILDAQNFGGTPQAVIHIPHRVPPGFHGNWVKS